MTELDFDIQDLLKFGGDSESCNRSLWNSSSCLLSQAAIGFFSSITSSLFGPLSSSLFGTYQAISEEGKQSRLPNEEEIIELSNLNAGIPTLGVGDVKASSERELEQEQKTTEDQKDDVLSSSSKLPEEFRQFDMVTGFSDHHFADGAGKAQLSQVKIIFSFSQVNMTASCYFYYALLPSLIFLLLHR